MARRPGQKERRWAHLLAGEIEEPSFEDGISGPFDVARPRTAVTAALADRVASLEETVEGLSAAIEQLRRKIEIVSFSGTWVLDLGVALALVMVGVYLAWHRGLAIGIGLLFVPLYLAGRLFPGPWLWGIMAAGVALQYVGHLVFEGGSPAFHKNLVHTLVGPLWVAAQLFRALGILRWRHE